MFPLLLKQILLVKFKYAMIGWIFTSRSNQVGSLQGLMMEKVCFLSIIWPKTQNIVKYNLQKAKPVVNLKFLTIIRYW